jgi:glucose repression mediator protein
MDIWFQIGHVYEQQKEVRGPCPSSHFFFCPASFVRSVDTCYSRVTISTSQYERAKDAWERVLKDAPEHAKVLQQLGWLYHQAGAPFCNQDLAVQYLTKSIESGMHFRTGPTACAHVVPWQMRRMLRVGIFSAAHT